MTALVPVSRPYLWGEEKAKLCEAVDAGLVSSRGPFLDQFEESSRRKSGSICRSSEQWYNGDSSGPQCSRSQRHDEVIVPDFTMISPVLAVLACGAIRFRSTRMKLEY
jgi:perosamine synthetase